MLIIFICCSLCIGSVFWGCFHLFFQRFAQFFVHNLVRNVPGWGMERLCVIKKQCLHFCCCNYWMCGCTRKSRKTQTSDFAAHCTQLADLPETTGLSVLPSSYHLCFFKVIVWQKKSTSLFLPHSIVWSTDVVSYSVCSCYSVFTCTCRSFSLGLYVRTVQICSAQNDCADFLDAWSLEVKKQW